MRRFLLPVLASCALLLSAAVPALAEPVSFETYEVTSHEEGGRSILIVTGTVPEKTTLPVDVVLTAPEGWQLQWAGEILGGDLSDDISADPRRSTSAGGDAYTFTLTRSRQAQIEVMGPALTEFDGAAYSWHLTWTPPADAPKVRMNVALPGAARISTGTEGAEFFPVDASGGYFSKTFTDVKAGKPLALAVTYTLPAASAPPASTAPNSRIAVTVVLVIALSVFAIAFGAILRKSRMRAARTGIGSDTLDLASNRDGAFGDREDDRATHAALDPESLPELSYGTSIDAAPRRSRLPVAIVVGVIAVLVAVGFAAGSRSSATQKSGGVVSRTYSTAEACTQASIRLTARPGVDLARSAEALLKSLESVPGISTAALTVAESRIDIGYCDSSASEAQLREVLASTGLVTFD